MTIDLPELEIGDNGLAVYIMQAALKYKGVYNEEKLAGNFDLPTFGALREFRRQHYLTGNTVCDALTWRELLTE